MPTNEGVGLVCPRLGISACLMGERVRYDGGHKHDPFLTQTLGHFVEWVPVCPEVEVGLGIPREPMRLEGDPAVPRLLTLKSRIDLTERMQEWAARRVEELAALDLHGFVFKSNSPSSGLHRVPVYAADGMPAREGRGLFAATFVRRFPLLPVEEEGRLNDPRLRENFIERVFAWHRWLETTRDKPTAGGLVCFHTAHKLSLLAHSTEHYRRLGRIAARAGGEPWKEVSTRYIALFMEGMQVPATPGKHANVLQHLMGYLKHDLDGNDKAELLRLIDEYRLGRLPLIVPITLLKHHLRRHPVPEWVHLQTYLNPYPAELLLRNHA